MVLDSAAARRKIESVDNLPTLPTVASEIIAIANSPSSSATNVGALINRDTALTSKVLKLVNSPFYGFPQRIRTINHAIVILGFNKVKSLVLTASVFELTADRKSRGLDLRGFWEHALGVAIATAIAAGEFNRGVASDDAFVGGLLHDFGKVILDQFLTEEYAPVLQTAADEARDLRTVEREMLGFDHQQVGTWVAETWKLPPALVAAIRYHHVPSRARDEREMVNAAHVGNILAHAIGVGVAGNPVISPIDKSVVDQYGIDATFFDKTVPALAEELNRAKNFFELINA